MKKKGREQRRWVTAGLSPSAPIDTSLTPLLQMKSRALFTLAILWKRILPLSGLGSLSPEGQADDKEMDETASSVQNVRELCLTQDAPDPLDIYL